MTHASLFSGIGGFDLAAEWMGWQNSFQCEKDPFCQKVLAKNFPDADRYTDIKTFDARRYRGAVDVLSAGFPCQPYSLAGDRRGHEDDRALWPHTIRIVDECGPAWFVGENVTGLLSLGIDTVLADLEAAYYSCRVFVIPAAAVGAKHQRDRLWILAHANGQRREERERVPLADAAQIPADGRLHGPARRPGFGITEPAFCGAGDGLPAGLVRVSTRAKQIKAYGNSIVPQVAFELFQALEAADRS